MRESCEQARKKEEITSRKGKEHCSGSGNREEARRLESWTPPHERWTKVNIDGSFVEQTGGAGVGVIAKNHRGEVIFTAWRAIFRCANAAEAEAKACAEGVRLATQWTHGSVIIETDCARVLKAMRSRRTDRRLASS